MLKRINFTKTQAFAQLQEDYKRLQSTSLKRLFLDKDRYSTYSILFNDILVDYSKNIIDEKAFQHLIGLADAGKFNQVYGYYHYNDPMIFETEDVEDEIEYTILELDLYEADATNFMPGQFQFPDISS